MMARLAVVLLVFAAAFSLPATLMAAPQEFEVYYDSGYLDSATGIAEDSAGNIIISGWASNDGLVAKYDPEGNLLWDVTFNADFNTSFTGNDVAVDSQDNIYAVGNSRIPSCSTCGSVLAKYSPDGVLLWQLLTLNGTRTKVAVDSTGVVHVLEGNYYVVRYDGNGNLLSTLSIGTVYVGEVYKWYDMVVSPGGGQIYLAGMKGENEYYKSILRRLNVDGTPGWERIHDFNSNYYGYYESFDGVTLDTSGDILVGGHFLKKLSNSNWGTYDAIFLKYAADGTLKWQTVYEGADNDYTKDVAVDANGSLHALIHPSSYTQQDEEQAILLVELSPEGAVVSDSLHETRNLRYFGKSLINNAQGDVLVCGMVDSVVVDGVRLGNLSPDAFLLKLRN